jgi:hypothetical protein
VSFDREEQLVLAGRDPGGLLVGICTRTDIMRAGTRSALMN